MRKYLGSALLISMFGTAALADAPTPDPCAVPAEPKKAPPVKPKKPKVVVQQGKKAQPDNQNKQKTEGGSVTVTNEVNINLVYEDQNTEEQGRRTCPFNTGAASNAGATANASAQANASSRQNEGSNRPSEGAREEPRFQAHSYGMALDTGNEEGTAILGFNALIKGFLSENLSLGFGGEGKKTYSPSSEQISARTGNLFIRYAAALGENSAESRQAFALEVGSYRYISPLAPGHELSLSDIRTDRLLRERYYLKSENAPERPGNFVGGRAGVVFESGQRDRSALSVAVFGGHTLSRPDWVAGAEVEGIHADSGGQQARVKLTALHNSAADKPHYLAGMGQWMFGVIGDTLSVQVNADGETNLQDGNGAVHAGLAVHPVNWMTVHGTAGRRWFSPGEEANIGTMELGATLGPARFSAGLRLEKPEEGRTRTGGQLSVDLRL